MRGIRKKFYIVGTEALSIELHHYLSQAEFMCEGYTLEGFLGDRNQASLAFFNDIDFIGGFFFDEIEVDSAVLISVLDCGLKQELHAFYSKLNVKILSFIHPNTYIAEDVVLGFGLIIAPFAVVNVNATLSSGVTLNSHATIGHDVHVGAFSTIGQHCDVTGHSSLGNRTTIGAHAVILPHISIGCDSVVEAGSVVVKHIVTGGHVRGNPAKKIKK